MKNIIFIAPPAAGKGTQSELLVKKYGYIHISTGDLLRNEVAEETSLGLEIKDIMSSGTLVSDEIVTELLRKRLSDDDIQKGFILDGYPRNVAQAEILNGILKDLGIDLPDVIYLEMPLETAMHRALGRVTCPKCKRGYNKYETATKPKVDNICDDCGLELVGRTDDTEDTFKVRYDEYLKNTEPLLNYYRELGILYMIDNSGVPNHTLEQIEEVI